MYYGNVVCTREWVLCILKHTDSATLSRVRGAFERNRPGSCSQSLPDIHLPHCSHLEKSIHFHWRKWGCEVVLFHWLICKCLRHRLTTHLSAAGPQRRHFPELCSPSRPFCDSCALSLSHQRKNYWSRTAVSGKIINNAQYCYFYDWKKNYIIHRGT